jgi:hypothetical protein
MDTTERTVNSTESPKRGHEEIGVELKTTGYGKSFSRSLKAGA